MKYEERRQVQITVVEAEEYESDFPPNTLPEFQAWLKEVVDLIPEEFRSVTQVRIEGYSSYDSAIGKVSIWYCRNETDEEYARRLSANMDEEKRKERAEMETLERLLRKYRHE